MAAKILALALAPALLLAGCNEHFGRRDSATSFAGDARAANAAIHTIDPWPRHAENTQIGMDGVQAQRAIEKYHRRNDPQQAQQPMQLTLTPTPGAAKPD